ncbi:MAG: thioredoxin fold domain-containing protein [Lysobacterales bacterium]|jgi:thiol:disulfide interchange protein DsbC
MRHYVFGILVLLLAISAPAAAEDDFGAVEERIRALAPNAKDIAISETPIAGVLMVQIQGDIVYATSDGKYLIQGRVIDMDTREDLTEGAKSDIRKELMGDIDPTQQIVFAPKEPDYELTVFTDIDCGYCRKLHEQVPAYNEEGISIRYMAFPRAGVGSRSFEKAVSVWCADDQQAAMTSAKAGQEMEPAQCENPVADQYRLGVEMGVTGTPALLTANGQLIPGYVPPAQLRQRLDRIANTEADE